MANKVKLDSVKKKRRDLVEEIEFPCEISASAENHVIIMKKDDDEIQRNISKIIGAKVEGNKIILEATKANKNKRKMLGTAKAHIKNMIRGLKEGFKYRLEIANVHFPMTVSVDKATNELIVKNFLGEKTDRRIKLNAKVNVKINKEIIEVESKDIELAGQVATSIEKGTRVKNRDRRIFQDGIYIIEKPGRIYK
ncbi:MAG: 50S ribosomal protein L6 [Candidatus Pacearchaeota archaeon]